MKPVERGDIVDYVTYGESRDALRTRVLEAKKPRRIHLGDHLTLLFENALTVRYQIQEMIRVERLVKEADILHEIATYNELVGGTGEVCATLLVEIEDKEERTRKLREWWALPERLYLELEDGTRVRPRFDERQRGDGSLSAVQYLRFPLAGRVPVAAGSDLEGLTVRTALDEAQKQALAEDLAS